MLNSFGHHVPSCCMMLYDVERSLISMKHLMQRRSTLHSCKRCKSSLMRGQRLVWPKIRDHYSSQIFDLQNSGPHRTTCCIRLATQYNTMQQWCCIHLVRALCCLWGKIPTSDSLTGRLRWVCRVQEPLNVQCCASRWWSWRTQEVPSDDLLKHLNLRKPDIRRNPQLFTLMYKVSRNVAKYFD